MTSAVSTSVRRPRLEWLDVIKGIAILWIVFFHLFGTYVDDRLPSPTGPAYYQRYLAQCGADDPTSTIACATEATAVAVARLGFHAVGVFLLLSGFGLAFAMKPPSQRPRRSSALHEERPEPSIERWGSWYRRRLLRLFPMYWVAHLIYLLSPFVARPEPIDYRFLLSALGDRVYPIDSIFYYANPAWWYFGLLLQLYLVFPVLFLLLQRLGTARFLVLCGMVTVVTRYVIVNVIPLPGAYVQGAFFGARLWEFAAGMALGAAARIAPAAITARVSRPGILVTGMFLYFAGLYSYGSMTTYALTDGLIATGLFLILAYLARAIAERRPAAWLAYLGVYSYGLYLVHQPYVTYIGERVRDFSMLAFLGVAGLVIPALVVMLIPLERAVNRGVDALATRLSAHARTVEERKAVSG